MKQWLLDLGSDPIRDERVVRPLFEWLASLPDFAPIRYDMNAMEHWRPWDLNKAIVDALTQRTQMFRIEGAGLFVLALGKHGEPPSGFLAWDGDMEVQQCFEQVPALQRVVCDGEEWERVGGTP